jgi:ABC-type dipeptide/oligopeptide/nickel transport system permease subunit
VTNWQRFRASFFKRWTVRIGLAILLIMILAAIFAPLIAPYSPTKTELSSSLAGPSRAHLLGTDFLGRDTLSRLIYGARTALIVGFAATTFSAVVGVILGLLAGYFGGFVSAIIMRVIDALLALPLILLALVVAAVLGGGLKNVIIALSIGGVCPYARLMQGVVSSTRENDYVLVGRAMGASNLRIMGAHVLPNSMASIIVMMTLQFGGLILAEAGLSFLGVGIEPPTAAWGSMINDGYPVLMTEPLLSLAPGICVMLVVFAFNMVGDGLREALDPRLRGTI